MSFVLLTLNRIKCMDFMFLHYIELCMAQRQECVLSVASLGDSLIKHHLMPFHKSCWGMPLTQDCLLLQPGVTENVARKLRSFTIKTIVWRTIYSEIMMVKKLVVESICHCWTLFTIHKHNAVLFSDGLTKFVFTNITKNTQAMCYKEVLGQEWCPKLVGLL